MKVDTISSGYRAKNLEAALIIQVRWVSQGTRLTTPRTRRRAPLTNALQHFCADQTRVGSFQKSPGLPEPLDGPAVINSFCDIRDIAYIRSSSTSGQVVLVTKKKVDSLVNHHYFRLRGCQMKVSHLELSLKS